MERRLLDAYDHMTMPDDCTRRIEARLQTELESRKDGQYTKVISPHDSRWGGWAAVAACLMLVLVMGSATLHWWISAPVVDAPSEAAEGYTLVTDLSIMEVEIFAAGLRQNVLEENWEAFSRKVKYPITIDEDTVADHRELVELIAQNPVSETFTRAIRKEMCSAMFCSWQGICMGDGQLWFNEVGGELKVTAINRLFADSQEVHEKIPEQFEPILSGESQKLGDMSVEEYCAAIWGEDATVKAFTLADLDDDGVNELVFSTMDADGGTGGYMVLRQEEESICAYTLWGRDLRKDGTLYSYTAKSDARLRYENMRVRYNVSTELGQQDKPLAQWHVYPCQAPSLVLESYRYASETGFSTHPGSPYYYLGTLLSGEAEWSAVQPWLAQQSVYVEEKGTFFAFDPDAPGCLMYGTLIGTGEQKKLTALGYYICDETGEYRAEAFDLDTSQPVYTVDPPPDDRGRVVDSVEAMQDYLGVDFYGSEISRDVQQIVELLDYFVHRYTDRDTEGMQEYMADPAEDLSVYPFTGEVSILSYGVLPDAAVNIGESWHTSVELLESGDPGSRYCLTAVLVKQTDGWKIHSCSLEKQ